MNRRVLKLQAGEIEYVDTGGPGPTLVLLHGALMDEGLWEPVIRHLSGIRCVVPILPMGARRIPRAADADQSPVSLARLVGELIEALALREVALVGNDTGGAIAQLLVAENPGAVDQLVLVSCDAFENFPLGLPGRTMAVACSMPGGLRMAMRSLRLRPLRRLPMTFGWMTKRPIPSEVFDSWLDAFAADRQVRRDVHKMMRSVDRSQLVDAAGRLDEFQGRSLVIWAAEDKVMPLDHAHQLSGVLGDARVELVADSYTLIPLDQPEQLATLINSFVREAAGYRRTG